MPLVLDGTNGITSSPLSLSSNVNITSTGYLQFNSGYGSVATAYGCRAWVNFNGTGTVAIRSSENVTSITDGGVGIYTVNLATAMPDTNFCIATGCGLGTTTNPTAATISTYSTTAIDMRTFQGSNSLYDQANIMVAVFR